MRAVTKRRRTRAALAGYALLAPSALGVLVFLVVPVCVVLWLTTQDWNMLDSPRFVGVDQIVDVLTDPTFLGSLGVTFLFIGIVVPAQIAIGMLLAVLLTKGVRGTILFRTLIVIPWISAPLALGSSGSGSSRPQAGSLVPS